ncbi:ribonuclease G [Sulfurifustis variabilis]|uniref:Ribonuclease G n=1 Tax=Sulfurifustis variabilis TaxID=1675686 RepID=A0A1B4V130_9GAMM|nr:ribonuclease G [Sulfurifustis variabilis]BAU47188.1 ribonuclease G [Sulfurifustis variabilis]
MSEEILINVTPQETRVAAIENGVLQEVYVERARSRGIVGNVYKGRVARILPGMQAAFVDIGLNRAAFLHASDIRTPEAPARERAAVALDQSGAAVARVSNGNAWPAPRINELLHDEQELVVQVVKDPLGTKGARLTTQITLPARYLVYMPYSRHIGVSQRIGDDTTRERLRNLLRSLTESDEGGYILRTMAETAAEEEIETDVRYLRRIWSACQERIKSAKPGELIHEDLPLALRAMRDLVRANVEKIRIDSRETYLKAIDFAIKFIPETAERIEYYPGERPIFDLYSVEDEIQKALARKVLLKSGGYLVIDQTEAMTTIDVNTGAYVGRKSLEETLFKTNLEAAQAIARQLRLRNLGGMIIVDFIDMSDPDHKRAVLRALEKALARDRTKVYMTEMSPLGLVELTRKRTRESLEHVLCQPCPVCQGRGTLKTPQTVCYEIFREILREARQFGADEYLVVASQVVIDLLLDEEATSLLQLQEFIGKPIQLKVEPLYHQEQYDVVLL